jgi:hypothetical protein
MLDTHGWAEYALLDRRKVLHQIRHHFSLQCTNPLGDWVQSLTYGSYTWGMQLLLKARAMGGIDLSSMTVLAEVEKRTSMWRDSGGAVTLYSVGKVVKTLLYLSELGYFAPVYCIEVTWQ